MPPTPNAVATPPRDAIPIQLKLAAAWTTFMFLNVHGGILSFYTPGTLQDILAGSAWQFPISEALAIVALALWSVPILMIALSTILPHRASRTTTLVVAPLYVLVSLSKAIGESWTAYFASSIGLEIAVLALVIALAWTWAPEAQRATPFGGSAKRRTQAPAVHRS